MIAVDLSSGAGNERTRAESYSGYGSPISVNSDAGAYAVASMNDLRAYGIEMGAGAGEIRNSGSISVTMSTVASSVAETNPNGLSGADGTSTARVGVSSGLLSAIEAVGGGDKIVINDGSITALMAPRAGATAIADAEGFNLDSQPDAKSDTRIFMNNNRAYGIQLGGGDDQVINNGTLTVENRVNLDRARAIARSASGVLAIDSKAASTVMESEPREAITQNETTVS